MSLIFDIIIRLNSLVCFCMLTSYNSAAFFFITDVYISQYTPIFSGYPLWLENYFLNILVKLNFYHKIGKSTQWTSQFSSTKFGKSIYYLHSNSFGALLLLDISYCQSTFCIMFKGSNYVAFLAPFWSVR